MGDFFVHLFYFVVFDFPIGGQLGDLLVKEANVCLVFIGHHFLLGFDFMEGGMQVLHFVSIHVSRFFNLFLQVKDPGFPLFNPIEELIFDSFEFISFSLDQFVLLLQQLLQFIFIRLQGLHQIIVTIFDGGNVQRMNFSESLFHVDQLLLSFPLDGVYLVLEQPNLIQQLLPLFLIGLASEVHLFEQLGNLVVLECDNFPQSVELDAEDFVLLILILLQVLQLKIEHPFKLLPHFVELFVLLLD